MDSNGDTQELIIMIVILKMVSQIKIKLKKYFNNILIIARFEMIIGFCH